MKYILIVFCFLLAGFSYPFQQGRTVINGTCVTDTIPVTMPAIVSDDYGIRYTISDSLWIQHPSSRYHILRWDKEKQYIIAKNDAQNKSDAGLYTRIDYMKFAGMEPYTWGFCLSVYNAVSDSIAEFGPNKTDRSNPRKGCNGFPFSRMKKSE
ncbi:hypothetical protein [Sediminibacterium sp.]|uniref:hypothetical protein n=1 Tax=Sediminibacterium sp. TaxID=1917865 RepID=UPI0025DA16E0|nr:hypothetical protein [Sediminibacterium sp.]MBW0177792.1 hypothetical protein [Sediminibacterium sp.]